MDQYRERSFNAFLSCTPLLHELIEQVDVGTKWYLLGTLLHVDDKRLDGIEQLQGHDDTSKTLKMFQHWLSATPTASRRQVLEALRKRVVNEHTVADKYKKYLKEFHDTTLGAQENVTSAESITGAHEKELESTSPGQENESQFTERELIMKQEIKNLELKLNQSFQIIANTAKENAELFELVKHQALSSLKIDEKKIIWTDDGVLLMHPTKAVCDEVVARINDIKREIILFGGDPDCDKMVIIAALERRSEIRLLVRGSPLGHDFVIRMSKMIPDSNLTSLTLCDCSTDDNDVISLVHSLKSAAVFQVGFSESSGITSASIPALAELIDTNHSLKNLDIIDTKIGPDGLPTLFESLNRNRELRMVIGANLEEHCKSVPSYHRVKDRVSFKTVNPSKVQ